MTADEKIVTYSYCNYIFYNDICMHKEHRTKIIVGIYIKNLGICFTHEKK